MDAYKDIIELTWQDMKMEEWIAVMWMKWMKIKINVEVQNLCKER